MKKICAAYVTNIFFINGSIHKKGRITVYTEHKEHLQINKKSDNSREKWTKPDRKLTVVYNANKNISTLTTKR